MDLLPPASQLRPYSKASAVQIYRLDLQYDGAPYHGWQSQASGRGVQDHVEQALAALLGHPIRAIGASRTDTGVHAEHQVAIFRTPVAFERTRWLRALHGLLPPSIGISGIEPAAADFHPAHAATGKTYRYRLWMGPTRSPQVMPYAWQIFADCDIAKMRSEAPLLIGTHDFSSFCATDASSTTRERTVLGLEIHQQGPLVELWISGPGFLKQMVRIVVGTLVDVGTGRKPAGTVATALAARDRTAAGRTAPAQGLSLVEIYYGEIPPLAAVQARTRLGYSVRLPHCAT